MTCRRDRGRNGSYRESSGYRHQSTLHWLVLRRVKYTNIFKHRTTFFKKSAVFPTIRTVKSRHNKDKNVPMVITLVNLFSPISRPQLFAVSADFHVIIYFFLPNLFYKSHLLHCVQKLIYSRALTDQSGISIPYRRKIPNFPFSGKSGKVEKKCQLHIQYWCWGAAHELLISVHFARMSNVLQAMEAPSLYICRSVHDMNAQSF